MVTVRYPNGFSIQYNDASDSHVFDNGSVNIIRVDQNNKRWIVAQLAAGSGAIVEFTKPCRMYSALEPADAEQFDAFMRVLRQFPHNKLKELKKALTKFDAKSWKGWKS